MFISARVDRWSAAARLLIGASPPVSHTHIDSLSSLLVQQPSCTSRPLFPPPFSFLSCPLPSLFLFLVVLPVSTLRPSPLLLLSRPLSLFIVIFVLSVSPQLSAFLSFLPPPPFVAPATVLRFSPCRPIIRSLFTLIFSFVSRPHTREPRNLHYFPRTYTRSPSFSLVFRTPTLSSSRFPVASIKAAVSKPIALYPFLPPSRPLPYARVRDFSRCTAFSPRCYCRLSDASQFALADFSRLRDGDFNTY